MKGRTILGNVFVFLVQSYYSAAANLQRKLVREGSSMSLGSWMAAIKSISYHKFLQVYIIKSALSIMRNIKDCERC